MYFEDSENEALWIDFGLKIVEVIFVKDDDCWTYVNCLYELEGYEGCGYV